MKHFALALLLACSVAAAAPPLPPSEVTIQLGKGQTAKVTRRAGDTSASVLVTVNKSAKVTVLQYVEMHGGLNADITAVLPSAFDAGAADERVRPTTEVPPLGKNGAFRTVCGLAALGYFDPIVYYNQPGRSHLHTFFGNTGVAPDSTAASLLASGNSTCRGGTFNRSAYWISALLDTKDNRPRLPDTFLVYYKDGDLNIETRDFQPGVQFQDMPAGLRMIAGNPGAIDAPKTKSDAAGPADPFAMRWKCDDGKGRVYAFGPAIPNCDVGSRLFQEVFFPQCWDGKNIDSPDHKGHMAYPVLVRNQNVPAGDPRATWSHLECPATHPVALPKVSYEVSWLITEKDSPLRYRLASDMYDPAKPGGYSSHGDWFGAWKAQPWRAGCVSANRDCHAHLTGDGREMF